jgi:hypothetical protein
VAAGVEKMLKDDLALLGMLEPVSPGGMPARM